MSNQRSGCEAGHIGLSRDYFLGRFDGTPIDLNAVFFVLRVDADPHARKALLAYIESVKTENPTLAGDIDALLASVANNS